MKMENEHQRLVALDEYGLLDTLPEKEYDAITSLAASICNTPIALISLITDTRQFFKSHIGTEVKETPVKYSFCAKALEGETDLFIIEDARKDERFKDNPLVKRKPHIVFYAGVPLVDTEGFSMGTICVIDKKPRRLEENQISALKILAHQVVQLFELRKSRVLLSNINEKLQRESRRINSIIHATRTGTWEWNIQTNHVEINDCWAEMLGYTREEVEPVTLEKFIALIYPDDRENVEKNIKDCFEQKTEIYNVECRFIHKEGYFLWVNAKGQVIDWTDDGKPLMMAGVHSDINELKLRDQRFKALVQQGSDLIAILDEEANYKYVSPTSTQVLDISPEEFIGKNSFDFIHPEDKDYVIANFEKLNAGQKQMEMEAFRFTNKEGEWRWVETVITNLMDDPSVKGIVANSRDVTERKLTSMKLQESEQRYSDLFQFNPQPMWVYDIQTLVFLDVNKSAIDSYGYSYDEFLQLTLKDIRPGSGIAALEEGVERLKGKTKHKTTKSTHVHQKKNGKEIIVEVRGRLIDYKGRSAELVLATDITKLTKSIEAIEEQNAKLRKIAWTQSHVVRAPLASLMGLVSLLRNEGEAKTEQDEILELIAKVASDLDNIITEVVATTVG